jgi:hypothetical protein
VLRAAGIARDEMTDAFMGRARDWRLWSFRDWRLEQYIAGQGYFAEPSAAGRTGETATVPAPARPDTVTMP